jgi:cobalt/nickel transport system permease protein
MSHLHVPDGLLPLWLWLPSLAVVWLALHVAGARVTPRRIPYQGALGGLALAAMAVPFGPLDVHLTLAGPIGILLGPAAAFQVAFVVSAILALMGHGGLTVVGLNTLLLALTAALAHALYGALARRLAPAWAMAWSTAAAQVVAGALWLAVMALALGAAPAPAGHDHGTAQVGRVAAVAVPLWLLGVVIESVVAFGLGRFLDRVHAALLPAARPRPRGAAAEAA